MSMKENTLQELVGKKVSVLVKLTKKNGLNQNYAGIVKFAKDGILALNPNNPNFSAKEIWMDLNFIDSIWILE